MDTLMSLDDDSAYEVQQKLAYRLKTLRLSQKLTRETLGKRSGVPAVSIKKFEKEGEISLKSLLKIALALSVLSNFAEVVPPAKEILTAAELNAELKRKRVPQRGSK
ncbi:MAG: XRE family transcriptional regulator [Proteobacteria bacterium]|nr:MAG: XRE family transcriptional regulator [Pseudomonadota bacterium]